MKAVATDNAPSAIGPYSQAIHAGPFLFVSGQIALDPKTALLSGDTIEAQTEQVVANIKAILESQHLALSNVCKTMVFLKNIADFSRFNEVYAKHFRSPYPARSTIEVSNLPKGALIEIETVAVT